MKKRNLKALLLNKKVISKLEILKNQGGNINNSQKECILTLDLGGINICFETQQKNCVSVYIACVTQTEFPTCRDCV
jgi:hypothetical protein